MVTTTSQKPSTPQPTDTAMKCGNPTTTLNDTQNTIGGILDIKQEIKTEDHCGKGSNNGKSEANMDVNPDASIQGDVGGKIIKTEDGDGISPTCAVTQVKEENIAVVKKEVNVETESGTDLNTTSAVSTSTTSSDSGVACKKKGKLWYISYNMSSIMMVLMLKICCRIPS